MKVLTWHWPVPEHASREPDWVEVMKHWANTWSKNGWELFHLTPALANGHPLARAVLGRVRAFPTCNPKAYEVGCWMRWVAAAAYTRLNREPVMLVDTDVLNYGFKPEHCKDFTKPVTFLDKDQVCCAVHLTPHGAQKVVETIVGFELSEADQRHMSDMIFFWRTMSRRLPVPDYVQVGPAICEDYDYVKDDPKRKPALIHFSAKSAAKGRFPKSTAIAQYEESRTTSRPG